MSEATLLKCIKLIYIFVAYSPLYSHANATIQGLPTVRAFRANGILYQEFHQLLDMNSEAYYLKICANRAFSFWLDMISLIYMSTVTLSFVVFDYGKGL